MALGDLENGVPIGSIIWFSLGDLASVFGATLGIVYLFRGAPHLRSLKTLAQYLTVAVILVPFASALLGASANASGGYWQQWRLWFFSDALAFLTVTPAILSWSREGREWARSPHNYLELAALMTSLVFFGYATFMGTGRREPPALLYSLVPLLLWAALRLGLKGVSTSMVVVAFLSILGTAHGRGPFSEQGPLNNVLSLQLFLLFAATPFMVLAVLVEERKRAVKTLRESEERLRITQEAVHVGMFEWDVQSNKLYQSPEMERIYGVSPGSFGGTYDAWFERVHPDDRQRLERQVQHHVHDGGTVDSEFRISRPSGEVRWLFSRATLFCDWAGRPARMLGVSIDITDRKRAEEALRESEARERARVKELETLLDAAPITILIAADAECKSITANRAGSQLHNVQLGSNFSRSAIRAGHPLPFRIMRDGVEIPTDELPLQRAAATGIPVLGEFSTVVLEDGTEHHMIGNTAPLFGEDGKPCGAVGAFVDITERKRAEEALQKSEEKFSKAFRQSPMALAITSATDHRYIEVNESFERFSGWRREELIGRTPFDIGLWVDPQERDRLASYVQDEGSLRLFESHFRMRDGTIRAGLVGAELIELDGEQCVLAVGMDVTEQKLAAEALRESEERFRLVADTAPALIWMSGTDKLCTFFNKGWLDFTGRPIEAELGNGWIERVHLEDFRACLETYTQSFDRREKFSMEFRLRRYDGEYGWVLDIGVPRFNQDGSFAGYIGSCIDVTERKRAEEVLSGVSRRLIEAQEQERTRIARELHDDIGQRLALLNIKLGQLQQNSPDLPAELHGHMGELRMQTSEIARDVQSMSHELHSSKLEYLGIANAMKALCHEFSDQQNVEVVFAHDEVPRTLPQEISLCLFRVLQEALQNAVKHSGVRHFGVELRYESDAIDLTVRDSGSGFDVQLAMKTRGLGLISMAERVKLVDGRLSIDSQPNCGTTIHARVPLSVRSNSMRAAV
jgi:PAS domain S-box-containing protein